VKWQGAYPVLTAEQAAEIKRISQIRRSLPTYPQLAKKWGVPRKTIEKYGHRMPKRYA
jgi:hypothetical protein